MSDRYHSAWQPQRAARDLQPAAKGPLTDSATIGAAMTRYSQSKQWLKIALSIHPTGRLDLVFAKCCAGTNPSPQAEWFCPALCPNDGRALRENRKTATVTWIGHATRLLQLDGLSIPTDPMFAMRMFTIKRLAPPGVALADLPPIDAVVVSHNHRDHLDESSVRALGPSVQYVVPLGLAGFFRSRGLPRA